MELGGGCGVANDFAWRPHKHGHSFQGCVGPGRPGSGLGRVFGRVFWSNRSAKSGGRVWFLESFFGRIPVLNRVAGSGRAGSGRKFFADPTTEPLRGKNDYYGAD